MRETGVWSSRQDPSRSSDTKRLLKDSAFCFLPPFCLRERAEGFGIKMHKCYGFLSEYVIVWPLWALNMVSHTEWGQSLHQPNSEAFCIPAVMSKHLSLILFFFFVQLLAYFVIKLHVRIKKLYCCSCLVSKSFPTLCNPVDCSPPGSSVYGISQARILEWIAISFSRASAWLTQGLNSRFLHWRWILHHWATGEAWDITCTTTY